MNERRNLVNAGLPTYLLEMGQWLWALEDTRRRTKQALEGIAQEALDWQGGGNGIGSLLYHLIRHQASHQGQILMLRSQMRAD